MAAYVDIGALQYETDDTPTPMDIGALQAQFAAGNLDASSYESLTASDEANVNQAYGIYAYDTE